MHKHAHAIAWIAGYVYFSQGALGLSAVALPLFLRAHAWSVGQITAVMSVAAVPWILKVIYGFLSDSVPFLGYRRKSYLILYLVLCASGWLAIGLLPATQGWVLAALLTANLGFAATDVVTDGLIVEHSTAGSSSVYQSIAWGSRSLGAIFGSVAGGWLAARLPLREVFLLTTLIPLLAVVPVLRIHERKTPKNLFSTVVAPIKKCLRLLGDPHLRYWGLLLLIVALSSSFGIPFFFFMRETLGFHETFLGVLASLGWFGAMFGSVLYLKWLRYLPPINILRGAILLNGMNILTVLFVASERSAFIIILLGGILGCLVMLPVMSAAAVVAHHSRVEGALFAVLMSVFNLGQILFGFLGGKISDLIGVHALILMAGMVAFCGLFVVNRMDFSVIKMGTAGQLPSRRP